MTIAEFLTLHSTGHLNFDHRLNVLYNPLPTPLNPNGGQILAITVATVALRYNGSTVTDLRDITEVLEEVQEITLTFDGVTYVLEVLDRASFNQPIPYFYFRVQSGVDIPNISDADILNTLPTPDITVNFHPFLNVVTFDLSDDNVLFNNSTVLRKSSFILEADKENNQVVPSNFAAILATSASKAAVQDSFYSDTGLTNARYNGSKSLPRNQAGIPPSISAREFTGKIFSIDTQNDVACGLVQNSLDSSIETKLLHTGPTKLPQFVTGSSGITNQNQILATEIDFNYSTVGNLLSERPELDVGDLLVTDGASGGLELMRVLENDKYAQYLRVARNYLSGSFGSGQALSTIDAGSSFRKVIKTDLYRLDDFIRSLSAVPTSQVYIGELHELVFTDPFGLVLSGSGCPPPLLMGIDNTGEDGG